jgi:peptide-methionine (R)-S-oxide reductase
MYKLLFLLLLISQTACSQTSNKANTKNNTMSKNIYYSTTNKEKVVVPDSVWKQILSPEVYAVARQKGTERPFSSAFETSKEIGTYHCVACGNPLFKSDTKFDS